MLKSIAALILGLGLACCAAAPAGVPRGANVEFPTLKDGWGWNWQRRVEHGCVDFRGDGRWVTVRLSVDPSRCGGGSHRRASPDCETCGPGLLYMFGRTYFQNYYTLRPRDSGLPCPLSPEQLTALRIVAHEALAEATTDAERRTLEYIDRTIAATDGATLVSGSYACTAPYIPTTSARESGRAYVPPEDPWSPRGVVPCDDLPAEAATTLPSPYDRYLQLACTQSGQAIRPVDGYELIFDTGPRWMWSSNARSSAPSDHYASLTLEPLSEAELESLRRELREYAQRFRSPTIFQPSILERTTLRLSALTSSGWRSQIYLFVPPEGSSQDVLGMECARGCLPARGTGRFFTVTPLAAAGGE